MPLPLALIPAAGTAIDIIGGFLVRFGIARWFQWVGLEALLGRIAISYSQFKNWWFALSQWQKVNVLSQVSFWYAVIVDWVEEHLGVHLDLTLDSWGDAIKEAATRAVVNGINDQMEARFGYRTNITKIWPMTDQQVMDDFMHEIGAVIAFKINQRYGTEFDSVWPPDTLGGKIKDEVLAELNTNTPHLLSAQDINALKQAVQSQIDDALLNGTSYSGITVPIGSTIDIKLAKRRANGRERQRKYRQTHTRTYSQWVPK